MTAEVQAEGLEMVTTVALRARRIIGEDRLSQTKLALAMGMSRGAFNDRLNEVKDFDIRELPVLASVLDTTVEFLLGFSDERSPRRAIGGGSMFVLPQLDEVRGCRDSNPRPSDLLPEGEYSAQVLAFGRRIVADREPERQSQDRAVLAPVIQLALRRVS